MRTQLEDGNLQICNQSSLDPELAHNLILAFPAPNCEEGIRRHPVYGNLLQQPKLSKTEGSLTPELELVG